MTNTALKRRRVNANARRWYRKQADRFRAQGLTATGTVPKSVDTLGRRIGNRYYLEIHGPARTRLLSLMWRERNIAAGLTRDGKPRRNKSHHLPRAMFNGVNRRAVHHANMRRRWKFYSARRIAAGLTCHGEPRKDFLAPSALELRWREFRATIQIPVERDWTDYGQSSAAREKYLAEAA
jgi:hypothetical protein